MGKYVYRMLICISIVISGCSQYKDEEFTISGIVTSIDENKGYVYIDEGTEIKYKDYKKLEIGQSVNFVLYSTYEDDAWITEKIKVKSVEIQNTP